jgi:hypothetical protein
MNLQNLSDKELLEQTFAIARKERVVTVELLRHLAEVERRQLYLEVGRSDLYDYVIKDLKISEPAAFRRIQSMRILLDVPSAAKLIETGELCISTLSKVQSAMKKAPPEDKEKVLQRLAGKSSREVDRVLATRDPRGPREFTRWLNENEVQLTFSLEKPDFQKLEELQSIRSHKDVQKTYRVIVSDLVKLGHENWNPMQRNAKPTSVSPGVNSLPPALKALIWQRDGGKCTYKIPGTDRLCGSTDLLQVDHIKPLALGGTFAPENLRLLCAAHNRARAEKTFHGKGSEPKK